MLVGLWIIWTLLAGFTAGWVVGRYGQIEKRSRTWDERRYLAAELARSNNLEIRQ